MVFRIADVELQSRFFLGSAGYPSPRVLQDAITASGAQVVTVGLRRQLAQGTPQNDFFMRSFARRARGCFPTRPVAGLRGRQ